ncbi:hypothetical protein [Mangrovicoccus ximenensis]|uniref:hypothetical protein n=1 Tax=Mangrovicoccus ximenensis TaxID=1911570 RepID=UPI0011AE38D2|nr:hypothetical protein [Mangrovicoccus ximenensis]
MSMSFPGPGRGSPAAGRRPAAPQRRAGGEAEDVPGIFVRKPNAGFGECAAHVAAAGNSPVTPWFFIFLVFRRRKRAHVKGILFRIRGFERK